MSGCIRYGYVVEIKHVNFCFCAWLHEQGRRRSAKQQKPNVPLHRAHFGEIFPEEAFAFLCPLRWPIKFRYCEKTIKLVTSKQSMRFLQFFVTFSEYPNFLLQFLLVERRKWFHKYFCPIVHSACVVLSRQMAATGEDNAMRHVPLVQAHLGIIESFRKPLLRKVW